MATSGTTTSGTTTSATTADTSFCSSVYTTDYSGTHSCLRQDGTFASCWNGYESVGSPAFCKSSDAGPATAPTPPTTAATSHCPTAYYADTLGNHTCTTSTGSFAQCQDGYKLEGTRCVPATATV